MTNAASILRAIDVTQPPYNAVPSVAGGGDSIQQAINDYIDNPSGSLGVYIPAQTFKLTQPLIVGRSNQFVALNMFSSPISFPTNSDGLRGALLEHTSSQQPVLIIQGARAVKISNIQFKSGNTYIESNWDVDEYLFGDLHDEGESFDKWVSGSRTNAWSPNCCVAIDPFIDGSPQAVGSNRYPDLEDYYGGSKMATPVGSSNITFDACSFTNAVVGLVISPPGPATNGGLDQLQNAENFTFRDCFFSYNREHFAICQSQSRAINLISPRMFGSQIAIDTDKYGIGGNVGVAPVITGAPNIGACRWVFNCSTSAQMVRMSNCHMEKIASLGIIGTTNSSANAGGAIENCEIDFYIPPTTYPLTPVHFETRGLVTIRNCTIANSTGLSSQPLRIFNGDRLVFRDCTLNMPTSGTQEDGEKIHIGFHRPDDYEDPITQGIVRFDTVKSRSDITGSLIYDTLTSLVINLSGAHTIRTGGNAQEATVENISNASTLHVGDVLNYSKTFADPNKGFQILSKPSKQENSEAIGSDAYYLGPLGIVTAIDGTTVSVRAVPSGTIYDDSDVRCCGVRIDVVQ